MTCKIIIDTSHAYHRLGIAIIPVDAYDCEMTAPCLRTTPGSVPVIMVWNDMDGRRRVSESLLGIKMSILSPEQEADSPSSMQHSWYQE